MATDTILGNLATSAKQDTAQTSLTALEGKTPALGQALAAASTPVVLTAAQVTALTPPATYPVTDNGGSLTVDGTVAVSNSSFPVTDNGGSLTVDATSWPLPTGAATEATILAGVRGVRRDTDDTPAADGGVHTLYTNQVGRLKSSSWPGAYAAVTGTITANAQTVTCDVARASNITMYCTGTFSTVNVTFEATLDGTNWFGITAARTNANTAELTTGNLSAAPAYGWEMSVNGYLTVRVRATAFTSGTQTWTMVRGAYATEPAPVIQTHAVTGSGNFTVVGSLTSAGTTVNTPATGTAFSLTTAATTNATLVKATAGNLYTISIANTSGAAIFVKLFNLTTAPTVGTSTPVLVIPVAANATTSLEFGPIGQRFATGISYSTTGVITTADTTAIAAGCLVYGTYL